MRARTAFFACLVAAGSVTPPPAWVLLLALAVPGRDEATPADAESVVPSGIHAIGEIPCRPRLPAAAVVIE